MKPSKFKPTASPPTNGVALLYDLEGFSRFFNQPDVQDYVPTFLNHVNAAVGTCLFGGNAFWLNSPKEYTALTRTPIHEKFLGDGALYVWLAETDAPLTVSFVRALCNRLWNLKNRFEVVVKKSLDEVPVADVPSKIRFGLARGTIYELISEESERKEYIGFCINLASRLQKYCPELGFIASARMGLTEADLSKSGYIRTVAKKIPGFPREVVVVDQNEYESLDAVTRDRLFDSL